MQARLDLIFSELSGESKLTKEEINLFPKKVKEILEKETEFPTTKHDLYISLEIESLIRALKKSNAMTVDDLNNLRKTAQIIKEDQEHLDSFYKQVEYKQTDPLMQRIDNEIAKTSVRKAIQDYMENVGLKLLEEGLLNLKLSLDPVASPSSQVSQIRIFGESSNLNAVNSSSQSAATPKKLG